MLGKHLQCLDCILFRILMRLSFLFVLLCNVTEVLSDLVDSITPVRTFVFKSFDFSDKAANLLLLHFFYSPKLCL